MTRKHSSALLALGAAAILAPASAMADTPGRHPRYLHARSDLRTAQMLLAVREEANVTRNLRAAEREVEAAIHEIDRAAVLDRKDLDDHPRVDVGLDATPGFAICGRCCTALRRTWSAKRTIRGLACGVTWRSGTSTRRWAS